MSGPPVIASYSTLRATPGTTYAVVVWGPRAGVERAWARLPEYWSTDVDQAETRGGLISLGGLVLGVIPTILGAITSVSGVPGTPPGPINPDELSRFEGARAGDWYCILFGTPSRGSSRGSGQFLADDLKWDLNGVGARDISFAIVNPESPFGQSGDRTNDAIATRENVRQDWADTVRSAAESARSAVSNVAETAEGGTSLLKSLTNPWVLIPVAVAAVGIVALFVVVPAILQVRVNR